MWVFFFKQKTSYEMRISDWSSDVCSSDLSVASADGAAAVVATALATFGSLDVLVNNAAISVSAPFDVTTPHDFRRHIDINLMGAYYICRAAWPHMRESERATRRARVCKSV